MPTAEVTYVRLKCPDEEGPGIKHAYMRRGHLRRQAIGPRSNPDHKIVFIRPPPVRPDLPFKADSMVQGYKVSTRNLEQRVNEARSFLSSVSPSPCHRIPEDERVAMLGGQQQRHAESRPIDDFVSQPQPTASVAGNTFFDAMIVGVKHH